MTKPIMSFTEPTPLAGGRPVPTTEHTPAEYANAASRVAQAREQVLGDATAKAAHDALLATIEERLAAKRRHSCRGSTRHRTHPEPNCGISRYDPR